MRTLDRAISVFEDRYAIVHPFQSVVEEVERAHPELRLQTVKLGRGNR